MDFYIMSRTVSFSFFFLFLYIFVCVIEISKPVLLIGWSLFIIHLFCCIFFTVSKLTKFFVVLFNRLTFWCAFCYFTLSSLDLLRFGFCTWEIIRNISLLHSKFIVGISFISRFRLCILSHHLRYTFFRKNQL